MPDTMVIANDGGGPNDRDENFASTVFVTRENNFQKDVQVLAIGKQCNGAALHPVNQELYYNNFSRGNLYRYDFLTYGAGVEASTLNREFICTIQDSNWEFNITMVRPYRRYNKYSIGKLLGKCSNIYLSSPAYLPTKGRQGV